ncbi:unnamed protein product [Coccothraustes coccothraustes]
MGGGRTRGCGSPRPSKRAGRGQEAGRETQPEPSKSQRWSPASEKRRAAAPHCVRRRALPVQAAPGSAARPGGLHRHRSARLGSTRLGWDGMGTVQIGSLRAGRRGAMGHGTVRLEKEVCTKLDNSPEDGVE